MSFTSHRRAQLGRKLLFDITTCYCDMTFGVIPYGIATPPPSINIPISGLSCSSPPSSVTLPATLAIGFGAVFSAGTWPCGYALARTGRRRNAHLTATGQAGLSHAMALSITDTSMREQVESMCPASPRRSRRCTDIESACHGYRAFSANWSNAVLMMGPSAHTWWKSPIHWSDSSTNRDTKGQSFQLCSAASKPTIPSPVS
jgi:hypothetical protein